MEEIILKTEIPECLVAAHNVEESRDIEFLVNVGFDSIDGFDAASDIKYKIYANGSWISFRPSCSTCTLKGCRANPEYLKYDAIETAENNLKNDIENQMDSYERSYR